MKKNYSEEIFNKIHQIEEEIKSIKLEEPDQLLIEDIRKILGAKEVEQLEKIENKSLEEDIKIKTIAINLNNFDFEQYKESTKKLEEKLRELEKVLEENEKKQEEIKRNKTKQKLLEYVYDLGLPIEDEKVLEEIIKKYKDNNEDYKEILRIIIDENIRSYTNEYKKEKVLTKEKMSELGIEESDQQTIQEIKKLISKTQNIQGNMEMANYLISLSDDLLIETLEQDISYNKQLMINIMHSLLEKINQDIEIEKSLEILNLIYEKYSEENKENTKENKEEKKLIFLRKPSTEELYIKDDLEKIESKEQLKILEKEFTKLIKGETKGKSLTGLPENLFEKKTLKARITYKHLPNNYILIINCYIKGNKFTQNIREFIAKANILYQIHLYEALATENPEIIEQTIKQEKSRQLSNEEQENYIRNFIDSKDINILDYFKGSEKNARKNK